MTGILSIMIGGSPLIGTVSIPDLNPNAANPGGVTVATLQLTNVGTYNSTNDLSGEYCNPTSIASLLDARLSLLTGDRPTSAPVGTWVNLGTTRTWILTATAGNIRQAICTLEIRESASQIVRSTCSVLFQAEGI